MRLRVGTAVAFGVGYLLGTRAGRERYHQIVRIAGRAGHSAPVTGTVSAVGDKARAVANLGVERARDAVGARMGWRDGDEAADALADEFGPPLASAINGRGR